MGQQHEQIARSLDRVLSALLDWQHTARAAERDRLAEALAEHRAVLVEHLDDEDIRLLPPAGRYLTQQEWDALGEHFVHTTPKSQVLIFLGAVLEDADDRERADMLGAMPPIARVVWRTVGRILYARRVTQGRGR